MKRTILSILILLSIPIALSTFGPKAQRFTQRRATPWYLEATAILFGPKAQHVSFRPNGANAAFSFPHVPLVNVNGVFLANQAEFLLVGHLPMVFALPIDVIDNLVCPRLTHGEHAVTVLPMEVGQQRRPFFDPLRRFFLQVLNQLRDGNCAREPAENMNVVDPTARPCRRALDFVRLVTQHTEHFLANLGILKVGATPVGGERNVQPDASEGLGHGLRVKEGDADGTRLACRAGTIQYTGERLVLPGRCPPLGERLGLRPETRWGRSHYRGVALRWVSGWAFGPKWGGGDHITRALPFAGRAVGPSARNAVGAVTIPGRCPLLGERLGLRPEMGWGRSHYQGVALRWLSGWAFGSKCGGGGQIYSGIAQSRLSAKYKDHGRLAWLDMDSEAGQEYWAACHESQLGEARYYGPLGGGR